MQSFWVYVLITIVLIGIGIGYSVYDSIQLKRKIKTLFNKQATLFRQKGNHIMFDHYYKHVSTEEARCIDDITWNDLSIDQLFHRINYHFTSVGEEYTYTLLRNFPGHSVDESIMTNVTTTSNAIGGGGVHNYPESIYTHAKMQLKKLKQLNVGN